MRACRYLGGDQRRKRGRLGAHWPLWVKSWTFVCTAASGLLAVAWLLLRSGPKPSRLAYPCQQAAFGAATAAFGVPLIAVFLSLRKRIIIGLHSTTGRLAAGGGGAVLMVALAVASFGPDLNVALMAPPMDYHPDVYLVNDVRGIEPGRFGGVDDLITLMGGSGLKWHRSSVEGLTSGSEGLIDRDDVVLIKTNAQWSERGQTNTDVLRGVIRRIVEHPDGFIGEIIVADNGQRLGSMDWIDSNAENHDQSAQDVVDDFVSEQFNISTYLWDSIRTVGADEYSDGDMLDGYIVNPALDPETDVRVSYPKFQSASGTYVSYKYGIWSTDTQTYDHNALVVVNMPVLKTHQIYGITASVKNHMGVITNSQNTGSHGGVGRGGLGSVLAEVRMPDITILDCIWIIAKPRVGPSGLYVNASRRNQLLAGTDPVALDMWAAKYIMIPQIIENGYSYNTYAGNADPDNPESTFRKYLDLTMNELLAAGIDTTNDYNAVNLHVWAGDMDLDGDVDASDFGDVAWCMDGPAVAVLPECEATDLDGDTHTDLSDIAAIQRTFTDSLP